MEKNGIIVDPTGGYESHPTSGLRKPQVRGFEGHRTQSAARDLIRPAEARAVTTARATKASNKHQSFTVSSSTRPMQLKMTLGVVL